MYEFQFLMALTPIIDSRNSHHYNNGYNYMNKLVKSPLIMSKSNESIIGLFAKHTFTSMNNKMYSKIQDLLMHEVIYKDIYLRTVGQKNMFNLLEF